MFLDHIEKIFVVALPTRTRQARRCRRVRRRSRATGRRASAISSSRATRTTPRCACAWLGWRAAGAGSTQARSARSSSRCSAIACASAPWAPADVDLACTLNKSGDARCRARRACACLPTRCAARRTPPCWPASAARDGRARVLRAWRAQADDVSIAHAYLSHRPLADAGELRLVTGEVTRMSGRAMRRCGRSMRWPATSSSDRESLDALDAVVPASQDRRRAAGDRGRAHPRRLPGDRDPGAARALRKQRLKSPDGEDLIDVLIRRLDAVQERTALLPRAAVAPVLE